MWTNHPFVPSFPEQVPTPGDLLLTRFVGNEDAPTPIRRAFVGVCERVTRQDCGSSIWMRTRINLSCGRERAKHSSTYRENTIANVYVLDGELKFKDAPFFEDDQ